MFVVRMPQHQAHLAGTVEHQFRRHAITPANQLETVSDRQAPFPELKIDEYVLKPRGVVEPKG